MNELVSLLYLAFGIIGVAAFIPTIKALLSAGDDTKSVSRLGWLLWTIEYLTVFLYASIVNGDKLFIAISAINFLGSLIVLSLAIKSKKHIRKGATS